MTWDEILYKALITTTNMLEQKYENMTNGEVIESLFPNVGTNFSNIIDLNLWWNAKYKVKNEIHCTCTDEEIAKSFIEDVEAVKDLLPHETITEFTNRCKECGSRYGKLLKDLATERTGHCKDCKWWKDSDGVFRRGIGAESQCPMNRIEVFEGNGYCFLFEPQESEDKE